MTKAKIDFKQGLVELEGSEEFVQKYLDEFKSFLKDEKPKKNSFGNNKSNTSKAKKRKKSDKPRASKSSGKNDANSRFNVVKDLDLSGRNGSGSLKDMLQRLKPSTNFERNLVFVHYLKETSVEKITADHIYTCYHVTSGLRIPKNVQQSLWDTSHHKVWLDTNSLDDIKLTTHGINYLEHEMPKKSK